MGWSAGGPYAAICAARMDGRVTAAALLSSAVPLDLYGTTRGLSHRGPRPAAPGRRTPWLASTLMKVSIVNASNAAAVPCRHALVPAGGPHRADRMGAAGPRAGLRARGDAPGHRGLRAGLPDLRGPVGFLPRGDPGSRSTSGRAPTTRPGRRATGPSSSATSRRPPSPWCPARVTCRCCPIRRRRSSPRCWAATTTPSPRRGGTSDRRRSWSAWSRAEPARARPARAGPAPRRRSGPSTSRPTSTPSRATSFTNPSPRWIQPRARGGNRFVEHRHVPALLSGLRLGQPDRADLGIGEGHPGQRRGSPRPGAAGPEMSATQSRAWNDRHMGEGTLSRDVADRPDAWRHPHAPVDRDARRLLVEPQRTHAEGGAGRCGAPWRPASARRVNAVPSARCTVAPVSPHGSTRSIVAAGAHLHPLAPQHLGDQLGRLGLLGPGEPRAGLDDGDPSSEAAHDLSDLEADGPAADDEQRRRARSRPPPHPGWSSAARPRTSAGRRRCWPVDRTRARRAVIVSPLDLDRRRAGDPGLAPDEVAALALEADRRRPCRPRSRWPPPGCAWPPATSRASRPTCRPGRGCAGPRPGGRRRGPSSWRGRSPSRGTPRRPARPRCRRRRDPPRPAPPRPAHRPGPARRRWRRPPPIYSPPQLVIWTGATIGVPTTSWIW